MEARGRRVAVGMVAIQPMKKSTGRKVALASAIALLLLVPVVLWSTWADILFLIDFESLGPNPQGYPEYRHRQTGIVFVSLPGGTFLMGSPDSEEGRMPDEGPVHEVTLSPFMIAKYEVTQGQWEAATGNNPSHFKGKDLPVEMVSWDDIQGFEATTGIGLPSEAQWEYACRAGTPGPYGDTGNLDDIGWYKDNSGGKIHPVGQKPSNQFGLHDVHGNVLEWCQDVYDSTFYAKDVPGFDPLSTAGSGVRVLRGGGWSLSAERCRSALRLRIPPTGRSGDLGFRPAVPTP